MKIDKVIFSTSEMFSVFWNINARVFKTKMGIEPVCLLLGDRSKTSMSDEFGKVIEVPIIPDLPLLIQITWSKFYWPIYEPDTTWLISDIDLCPLQTAWFTTNIESVPNDNYAHLDADGITQLSRCGTWLNGNIPADTGCGSNLPGHYHAAKGNIFRDSLEQHGSFEEELKHIVHSGKYNNTRGYRECDPIDQHSLWCAEELRSTRALRRSLASGKVKFTGFSLRHGISRSDGDRIDKSMYNMDDGEYMCDLKRLRNGSYVDLHCIRPFKHFLGDDKCQQRLEATVNTLKLAGMLDQEGAHALARQTAI